MNFVPAASPQTAAVSMLDWHKTKNTDRERETERETDRKTGREKTEK